jgi:hypothetical protein
MRFLFFEAQNQIEFLSRLALWIASSFLCWLVLTMLTWQFMMLLRLFVGLGFVASFAVLYLAAKALTVLGAHVARALSHRTAQARPEEP